MGTDIIVPEILLLEKLEEVDKTIPQVWQQMKNEVTVYDNKDKNLPASSRIKRKMLITDFVNKAIELPLEVFPKLSDEVEKQLYRLHLFCCQQAVHKPEVRRNPLVLGFRALDEMHTALVAILNAYRLVHPECPYSWDKKFFQTHILTHKGPDGHTIIAFHSPLTEEDIEAAISEEFVTDWLIYRAHDHAGARTLRDIKNNLLDVPNFEFGGDPISEFSRFERKLQEKRNRKKEKQDETLETEFRKVLVQTAAKEAVEKMLSSGMSAMDLLNQAFNGDLSQLAENLIPTSSQKLTEKKEKQSKKIIANKDTKEIDNIIAGLLEEQD